MNPTCDFNDQVAIVTGASSGMGLATAEAFADAGAAVVLADINEGAVSAATDKLTVAALVARTVTTFGRLDMAFNNAGVMISPCGGAR